MKGPIVTVIIPTKNSYRTLDNCLRSFANQKFRDFEIIIVDGYSKDNTTEIAKKYTSKIFYEHGGSRASACNVGIKHARGKIIALTDDDCEVPENWLGQIVSDFEDETLDVLGGPTKTPEHSSKVEKAFGALQNHLFPLTHTWSESEKIIGCNSAYRKKTLVDAGGFNENLITAEETELHFRLRQMGKRMKYSEDLVVLHNRRNTFGRFWKQQFKGGLGKGQWLRLNPSAIKPTNCLALSLVFGSFVLLPILILLGLAPIVFGFLLMGALSVIVFSLYTSIKEEAFSLFPLIALSSVLAVYAQSLGQLCGLMSERHPPNLSTTL